MRYVVSAIWLVFWVGMAILLALYPATQILAVLCGIISLIPFDAMLESRRTAPVEAEN